MVKDAYPFLFAFILLFGAASLFLSFWWALPGLLLLGFVINFFRNPERTIPPDGNVISPADGKVIVVQSLDPEHNDGFCSFISIFMNVFDVHVNRAPIAGTIADYHYQPGKFLPAGGENARIENERNLITLEAPGRRVRFSQVAGLIARRIVFWHRIGDSLERGQRIGLIRFGSRVDLWLPENVEVMVRNGDKVRAGTSILGRFR